MQFQIYLLITYLIIYVVSFVMDVDALIRIYNKDSHEEMVLGVFNTILTTMYIVMIILLLSAFSFRETDTVLFVKWSIIIFNTANIFYIARLSASLNYIRKVIEKR